MRKIELPSLSEEIYLETGRLILLFSYIEWLVANILLLCQLSPIEYASIENLSITQRYFEVLLKLNFSRKLAILSGLGFDSSKLGELGEYRNMFAHGIIFEGESPILKRSSSPNSAGIGLQKNDISKNIESLKEEGGKLIEFLKSKGYKPKEHV